MGYVCVPGFQSLCVCVYVEFKCIFNQLFSLLARCVWCARPFFARLLARALSSLCSLSPPPPSYFLQSRILNAPALSTTPTQVSGLLQTPATQTRAVRQHTPSPRTKPHTPHTHTPNDAGSPSEHLRRRLNVHADPADRPEQTADRKQEEASEEVNGAASKPSAKDARAHTHTHADKTRAVSFSAPDSGMAGRSGGSGGRGANEEGGPQTPPKVRAMMSKIDSFLDQRHSQRSLRSEARRYCTLPHMILPLQPIHTKHPTCTMPRIQSQIQLPADAHHSVFCRTSVCAKLQGKLRVRARVSFRILFVFSTQPGGDGSTANAYCKHCEGPQVGR